MNPVSYVPSEVEVVFGMVMETWSMSILAWTSLDPEYVCILCFHMSYEPISWDRLSGHLTQEPEGMQDDLIQGQD
jgi:hypothetical protein